MKLATGKKLAKPRNRVSASRTASPRSTPQQGAADGPGVGAVEQVAEQVVQIAPDSIIRLGTQLTIREAVPLRAELLERVDAVDPICLDASAVQKVDCAGLQVLLAFALQRRKTGGQVSWTACSEPLRKAAVLLALAAPLGLPSAGGAA